MSDVFNNVTELLCYPLQDALSTPTGRLQIYRDLGNVLIVLGAGTQGFFTRSSFTLASDEQVQAHFENDALLNMLARRLQNDAGANPSRFAIVTLNVLWEFSHQFSFHGTIGRNSIPEPNNTTMHLAQAQQYIRPFFMPQRPTHIVIVGIGMTSRNGKGFPQFLNHVYKGGIQSMTIVDPCETISSSRQSWLRKTCNMDLNTFPIHHVRKPAQEWILPLRDMVPDFCEYTGPTKALFFRMLQTSACAFAHRTNDNVVREMITWLVENNGLKYADIPRSSRCKPQKIISRIDESVAADVLALTIRRDPKYWLQQRCTRVLKLSNANVKYIHGTIICYNNSKWQLRHDDGDKEWLELYEVILGVQLFHVEHNHSTVRVHAPTGL